MNEAAAGEYLGLVRVSPAVLRSVAALSAMEVAGVMAVGKHRTPPRGRVAASGYHDGVRVQLRDDSVTVDIDLTVDGAANLVEVGRQVQRAVTEAIEKTVGFAVTAVNVRIQNVA